MINNKIQNHTRKLFIAIVLSSVSYVAYLTFNYFLSIGVNTTNAISITAFLSLFPLTYAWILAPTQQRSKS